MTVIIYSTTWCGYCKYAKELLNELKVPFVEYDIEEDPAKADEMYEKSGHSGVPQLDINGKMILGFRPDEIKKALGK